MFKNRLTLVVIAVVLFFSGHLKAQEYSKVRDVKQAEVNFTELANYYKAHPLQIVKKMPFDEDELEAHRHRHNVNPSEVHMIDRSNRRGTGLSRTTLMPASPAPIDSFLATLSNGSAIPPDTHGAVDSQYCVTAINIGIHIQNRDGSNVFTVGLDAFWASLLPAGTGTFDPRVHYDPFNKRWILVTDAVNGTSFTGSTVLVAVSATSDPTGTWHMYSVSVDGSGASWMDFPNAGFNNRFIAVTGNMFPNSAGGASGSVAYIYDYARMRAGLSVTPTRVNLTSSFSIAPALTYDTTVTSLFALESWDGATGTLRLWKIAGPTTAPTMTTVGYPTTTTHWRGNPPGSGGFAKQVDTTVTIESGDDRITSCTYRNNTLWTSFTAFLPATGTITRSGIMWWQLDTLANPIQNGIINDAAGPKYFLYSSIAVNSLNDVLVGYGYLSAAIHPSCGYSLHMHTDPLDSMRAPHVYRSGVAKYYTTFGHGRNRWGDYSNTCVDPRNDIDFWTIQESSAAGTSANWDTWWANVQFCPKPYAPVFIAMPPVPCPGDSVTYTIDTIPGVTAYFWNVSGTGWVGSSTTNTIRVLAGTGVGTILVYATNACGQGESRIIKITPQVIPSRLSINTINPPCIGGVPPVFSATSFNTTSYSWSASNNGWSGTSGSTSLTATMGTGTGMIICTAMNSCGSIVDTIYVNPLPVPVTTFSVTAHTEMTHVGDVITFTGSAPAGSTYTWDFGGGVGVPGTGAGPQTVTWPTIGVKTVVLTVDNAGCNSSSSDMVNVIANVGVKPIDLKDIEVSIMPNPSEGIFQIVLGKVINKTINIRLIDMQGREVLTNQIQAGSLRYTVNAGYLPAGVYSVNLDCDGSEVTKKVTIVR